MVNLRALQQQKAALVAKQRAALDTAQADGGRDLNADEVVAYDANTATIAALTARIDRESALVDAERSIVIPADDTRRPVIEMGQDRAALDNTRGFKSLGEFVRAVHRASGPRAQIDERLTLNAAAPAEYGGEGTPADGGYMVPPQYSRDIFTLALSDDALLPLTDNVPLTDSNSMVFPKDETTPWGTDGVRAYWQGEATAATQTKPVLSIDTMRLNKLMALVPMTDELLADAPAASAYITPLMARSIQWKTNDAILNGTGTGQPLGVFTSAAAVVVAKDAAQATGTLSAANVLNMLARIPPASIKNAVFLITPDLFPLLATVQIGNSPMYLPALNGALQNNPYGMLMGRPLIISQHAALLSAQGDLSLVALDWYRTITKAAGVEMAQSIHLFFDADVTAFRATFRLDGAPKLSAPITQAKSANKLSPFVQLGAR